jgi:hypothetical protein
VQVANEYIKVRWLLRGENDRYLASLPQATDSKIAAMTMLHFVALYSVGFSPEYGVLAFLRLLRLTIEYGTTVLSATAFCGYGFVVCVMSGQVERGYPYGQIALAVLYQADSQAWLPRVYILVNGGINLCVRPFRECLEPLLYAQRTALKTGDIEGSTLSAALCLFIGCQAGKELIALKQYARTVWFARESHGQKYIMVYVFVMWKLCSDLPGTSLPDLSIDGAPFDASHALRCANKEGTCSVLLLPRTLLHVQWGVWRCSRKCSEIKAPL